MRPIALPRHDPEIRFRHLDGSRIVEQWSYVTDYQRDVITTFIFENGRVTGLRQEPWNGAWSEDTIADTEMSALPDAPADSHARGQARACAKP